MQRSAKVTWNQELVNSTVSSRHMSSMVSISRLIPVYGIDIEATARKLLPLWNLLIPDREEMKDSVPLGRSISVQ